VAAFPESAVAAEPFDSSATAACSDQQNHNERRGWLLLADFLFGGLPSVPVAAAGRFAIMAAVHRELD
jgi:hypothetical protein